MRLFEGGWRDREPIRETQLRTASFLAVTRKRQTKKQHKTHYTMKAKRLYALLALLLMAGGVTMQAQEYPYNLEEIRSMGDTVVFAMNYIDETTLLTLASKTNIDNKPVVFVQKMRDDGEVLASAQVWTEEFLAGFLFCA